MFKIRNGYEFIIGSEHVVVSNCMLTKYMVLVICTAISSEILELECHEKFQF